MSIRYFYMNTVPEAEEWTSRVWTPLEWHSNAEELDTVESEWVIEDPDSSLVPLMHRRVYVLDDEAPEDHTVIGMGSIASIHLGRSEVFGRTALSRAWRLTISDINIIPKSYLFEQADDMAREVETDLERIAAYLATDEAMHFAANTDYIATTGGVTLDEHDYAPADSTPEGPYDVFIDGMDASGRNAFVLYDETKGPPDFSVAENGELAIWYDAVESELWDGDVAISNDLADIDPDNGVFAPLESNHGLELDGSRIAARLHAAYDGGNVTTSIDASIASKYTRREATVTLRRTTNASRALLAANRMREAGREPEARIQWGYQCGPDHVNALMAGQAFMFRATHYGGLEAVGQPDYTQEGGVRLRAMNRSVRQVGPATYEVTGEAVPAEVPEAPPEPEDPALRQTALGTSSSSFPWTEASFPNPTGVGGLLLAVCSARGGTGDLNADLDDQGWTLVDRYLTGGGSNFGASELWMKISDGSEQTVRVTYEGSVARRLFLMEYTGFTTLDDSDPHSSQGSGSSLTTDSMTVGDGTLLIGLMLHTRGVNPQIVTSTVVGGFTELDDGPMATSPQFGPVSVVGYQFVSAGTYAMTATTSIAIENHGTMIAAFTA